MNKKNYGKRSIDDLSLNDRWLRLSILRKLLAGFAMENQHFFNGKILYKWIWWQECETEMSAHLSWHTI